MKSSSNLQNSDSVPIRNARIEVRNGHPCVTINGEPTFFATHKIRSYQRQLKENWPKGVADSVRKFRAQGIHRFELRISTGWKGIDGFDAGYGSQDYPFDKAFKAIISSDPAAQVVLRIGLNMVTDAWRKRFPDELERNQKGETYSASFASDLGFEAMERAYQRLVEYVELSEYAGHVAGYNIFLEFEGVPCGSREIGAFTDYSPVMRKTFRAFLKKRYGKVQALREAWGDPGANFRTVKVPSPEEHLGGDPRFIFHHPVKGRKVRDYYDLMDELTVRRHRQIARAVKKACGYNKLVGIMGGYSQDAGEPRAIMSPTGFPVLQLHKQHFSGPGCWGRAFEIPEIDFYFACTDYLNTGMGGVCLILNMPNSIELHGKLAYMEDDQRTHLHQGDAFNPSLKNAYESIMVHRRNMALLYTEAGLSDWMEQACNWLLHPELLKNMGLMNKLLQNSVSLNSQEPDLSRRIRQLAEKPDAMCVLFDEESQGWTKPVTLLDELLFWSQRNRGLAYAGVPVRHHLLSDLAHDNFPSYKFFILPNAYHWTAEKEALLRKVKRNGNVLLWIYGAGYVGDKELNTEDMQRTTGIKISCDPVPWEHRISITDFTHAITRNLPGDLSFGTSRPYAPIFHVTDKGARTLGRSYGNRMTRHSGLSIKEFGKGARGARKGHRGPGDYASIYCEAPELPAVLLREMARYAGAHVYLESSDFLIAGKDIIMVHSAKPGRRTLHLPRQARVTEAFSGKVLAESARAFDFEIDKKGGTCFFRLA